MEKEYVISVEVSEQVTEDKWVLNTKTLKVTPETTIGEIDKWIRVKTGYVSPLYFKVNELQHIDAPKEIEHVDIDDLPY